MREFLPHQHYLKSQLILRKAFLGCLQTIFMGGLLIPFEETSDIVWFSAQIAVFFLLLIYTITLIQQGRKSQTEIQREIFYGFGLFALSCVFLQLFFLIHTWYQRVHNDEILPRLLRVGGTGFEYVLLLCFSFGFIFLMHGIEKHVLGNEKVFITKLNLLGFILLLIPYLGALIYTNEEWMNYWTYAAYPGLLVFGIGGIITIFGSFLIYLRLGFKSSGSIRKKGFLIGFGLLSMYLGLIVGSEVKHAFGGWIGAILGPGLIMIGTLSTVVGQRIEM